jgi:DNA-binding response OmpR family regulator
MRLLIIEDNPKLQSALARLLTEQGYAVDTASDVRDALAALDVAQYDLLVLDLALPDGDGREILRKLRRGGRSVPVLVATARTDVVHRVATLDEGADDYLLKPFSMQELLARIRALLRRPHRALQTVLSAGNVTLDTAAQSVTIGGDAVELPRREAMVLEVLLRDQGRLVSRGALEQAIYPMDTDVTPNATEAAVSRLRRKLECHGATVAVSTMRGLGYILAERP